MGLEFGVHQFQHIKLGVHIAQAVLIFVSFCMCIAVLRSSANVDSRLGWAFGLCFLTIIPLIYLTMTPRFPRTRKFANPYAMAIVDLVFAILWLSAFAAVANWNGTGECKSGCKLSKAVVGLDVFIWLFWCLSSAMSIYGVLYYRREGYLPGASRAPHNANMIDPDKEAFSTAPPDEYAPIHDADAHHEIHDASGGYNGSGSYGGPSSYGGGGEGYNMNLPTYAAPPNTAYVSPQVHDEGTAYSGYGGAPANNPQLGGRVQFPEARYENV